MSEIFKPIPVVPASNNSLLFSLRCLFDLQLHEIRRFLSRELVGCRGRFLDVGAGQAPWRELFDQNVTWIGLDVETSWHFGMSSTPDVVYYDGISMPFDDGSFDCVLCVEVLEHVPNAEAFVSELLRVLRRGGSLVLTIPWAARVHHLPHDYRRLTRYGLNLLLSNAGFRLIRIEDRGNDVAAIANQLIVIMVRLARPGRFYNILWTWPLCALLAPFMAGFVTAAHMTMRMSMGTSENPLGYQLVAFKP